jgi:hypothetical protein
MGHYHGKRDDDTGGGWGCAIVVVIALGLLIGTCVLR